ncbi:2'-5' RNA ligase family protein [Bacillus sp. KH172YL63]|uniref:2'-5' RNA ligase family protein n=1 Tax=Bacillus sp. KH172YL63 TaxID=2709784 RepID=UPI0013E467AE|nr:2'-5' RNA ligase family protein [Bacillus sp. KH172YL63]BCB04301.1 hypothetical protein KH172YL63_24340 [Bacillus sp. KH172YL63]
MQLAVHLFPRAEQIANIQEIRRQYAPLSDKIPPHVTLVFPFTPHHSAADILLHVRSAADRTPPFHVTFEGVSPSDGGYIFLNVIKGADSIISLHDELYRGLLSRFLNHQYPYTPHMTLGRLESELDFHRALLDCKDKVESFSVLVEDIIVEEIDDEEYSNVIGKFSLRVF